MSRPSLQEIGDRHGTDKGDSSHRFYGASYLAHYDRCFDSFRNSPVNLLEIGVMGGASLRMWREYFPNGQIFGLDIDPACQAHAGKRINVTIGNQASAKVTGKIARQAGGWFDIVIDDGSHVNSLTLASFTLLWPHVCYGGWYFIEDLRCSYKAASRGWPGMKLNPGSLDNDRAQIETWFLQLIRDMDRRTSTIHAVHFWHALIGVQKIPNPRTVPRY